MSMSVEDKLFLDRFNVHDEPHIKILNPETCLEECSDQPCLFFCPASVYKLEEGRISVAYEGCLECGSCRIGCPHLNIEWHFPTGGYGVRHKFG
jgi:ferredoxin like protein